MIDYLNKRIKVINQEIYGKVIREHPSEVVIEDEDAETLDDQLILKNQVEIVDE